MRESIKVNTCALSKRKNTTSVVLSVLRDTYHNPRETMQAGATTMEARQTLTSSLFVYEPRLYSLDTH